MLKYEEFWPTKAYQNTTKIKSLHGDRGGVTFIQLHTKITITIWKKTQKTDFHLFLALKHKGLWNKKI